MQDPYGALNAAKSIGQLASKTATSSFGSTFINALPTPLAFAGVNQVLNYLMTVRKKKRAQMISNIVKEEQMIKTTLTKIAYQLVAMGKKFI